MTSEAAKAYDAWEKARLAYKEASEAMKKFPGLKPLLARDLDGVKKKPSKRTSAGVTKKKRTPAKKETTRKTPKARTGRTKTKKSAVVRQGGGGGGPLTGAEFMNMLNS